MSEQYKDGMGLRPEHGVVFKEGHSPDPSDADAVSMLLAPCRVELARACGKCRRITLAHLTEAEVKELHREWEGQWWALFFFRRGWNIRKWHCEDCSRVEQMVMTPAELRASIRVTEDQQRLTRQIMARLN